MSDHCPKHGTHMNACVECLMENLADNTEQLQARVEELERVYTTGIRMRETAVVDDDFPEMMHDFDSALRAAKPEDKP